METLRGLRENHYLSRKTLAKRAGVSESTIVRMEEGKQHTQHDVAERVLKALSKEIGRTVTINDIEGLNIYNVMRDRRHRGKATVKQEDKAVV
jgi:predicted transcriptional regulator